MNNKLTKAILVCSINLLNSGVTKMEEMLKSVGDWIITKGLQTLIATVVLVVLWCIVNVSCNALKKKIANKKVDKTVASVTITVIRVLLKIVLIGFYIGFLGVETSSIAAAIASIGLTIGLALQGSLSNLAGGVVIIVTKLFKVGDYIECNGEEGTVENIDLFFTTIVTLQNQVIKIPNSTMANSVIENYTEKDERRLDLTFSIAYENDFIFAKQLIMNCIEESGLALDKPAPPFVKICKHNESSIDIVARVWTHNCDYWNLNFYLLEAVKIAFDQNGVTIPFNQLDVHLVKDNESSNKQKSLTASKSPMIADEKRLKLLKKSLEAIEKPASNYVSENKKLLIGPIFRRNDDDKNKHNNEVEVLTKKDIVKVEADEPNLKRAKLAMSEPVQALPEPSLDKKEEKRMKKLEEAERKRQEKEEKKRLKKERKKNKSTDIFETKIKKIPETTKSENKKDKEEKKVKTEQVKKTSESVSENKKNEKNKK